MMYVCVIMLVRCGHVHVIMMIMGSFTWSVLWVVLWLAAWYYCSDSNIDKCNNYQAYLLYGDCGVAWLTYTWPVSNNLWLMGVCTHFVLWICVCWCQCVCASTTFCCQYLVVIVLAAVINCQTVKLVTRHRFCHSIMLKLPAPTPPNLLQLTLVIIWLLVCWRRCLYVWIARAWKTSN